MRRLLEHQKFKAAAELLHDKETLRSAQWARPDSRIEEIAGEDYEPEIEVDLFSLLTAFKQVLERARERPPVALPPELISIETRIEQLLERLSETEACGFEDLFAADATRADMITTFLAMLEMIRLKLIRVFQQGGAGAIRIYKRARPADAPHPIHDPEDEYTERIIRLPTEAMLAKVGRRRKKSRHERPNAERRASRRGHAEDGAVAAQGGDRIVDFRLA